MIDDEFCVLGVMLDLVSIDLLFVGLRIQPRPFIRVTATFHYKMMKNKLNVKNVT